MTPNNRPSEVAAVVGVIDPDANAAGTVSTGWVDASKFTKFLAIVMAGDLGALATIDAKIEQAKSAAGTDAKDLVGKAITQLTKAGNDDNKQALINIKSDELDINGGFTHLRLTLVTAAATSDGGGLLLGFNPRYGPASDHDLASVDEIVG